MLACIPHLVIHALFRFIKLVVSDNNIYSFSLTVHANLCPVVEAILGGLSGCCLMPNKASFSYIMAVKYDFCPLCTILTQFDLYSDSSPKQVHL